MSKATGPQNKNSASSAPKKTTTRTTKTAPKKTANATTKKATTTQAQQAVNKAEKKVNKAVSSVSKKLEKKVSPELRAKATKFASQADRFAAEVEAVGDELEQLTEHILPAQAGSTAMFVASYDPKVSRLFIFRCLRLIVQTPIIAIRSVWYTVIAIIHVISMFLSGRRSQGLRSKQTRFRRHVISRKAYMTGLVDHRPELIVD